ncbi:MAG TPA: ABC transporter permease subunit [Gemmatimonadales bacterium]|nr:ABC transporter permease subunit [Gemmatimonadales bacterium]
MPKRADAVLHIAAAELRAALAGRLVQAFGALFALLALAIAVAGLGASGQLLVQGFTRTAVSLLTLALYLLPLLGLVVGANAFGAEDGGTELLLAQPVARTDVVLGRGLGLAAALALVGTAGFGLAGAVVGAVAGPEGLAGYLLVAAGATGVGLVGLALGVLLGALARRRSTAVGAALAAWLVLAVLYDLAAIVVLQFVGDGQPGPVLLALLALNPLDGIRALALTMLGADVLLGPTGAAMQRLLGESRGAILVLATLAAWLALPAWGACAVYRRRDF